MKKTTRTNRLPTGLLLLLSLVFGGVLSAASGPTLLDLEGEPIVTLGTEADDIRVFVFTRSDCPISNRYAPELRRIHDLYAPRGVRFWLVYPDPAETIESIRAHIAEYDYPTPALRDPEHRLVAVTGASVTPEVAVYRGAELIYRGRIDDRYVAFGKSRAEPSTHDLADAIAAALDGRPVDPARTDAVGCYLSDLK